MIQMHFQTSKSTMIPISDLGYIYELARCSKCQNFIVLKSTNCLYGFPNDCSCIHEISIPFPVNTDLTIELEGVNKDLFTKYSSFFIPDKYNWFILPDVYWDMYIKDEIYTDYDFRSDQFILKNKFTSEPIEFIPMSARRIEINYIYQKMISQLEGFFNRWNTLSQKSYTFKNMQNDEGIRYIFDSKVSIGRSLIKLNHGNMNVAFYMYKTLFSLAKSDSLEIDIRFDTFQSNVFMATFRPIKKRNPITTNTYGVPFSERVHCMYVNLNV